MSKYSNLESFKDWVNNVAFELVQGVQLGEKMRVSVETQGKFEECVSFQKCLLCKDLLIQADIIESVMALNWQGVDELDLQHVVSIIIYIVNNCET